MFAYLFTLYKTIFVLYKRLDLVGLLILKHVSNCLKQTSSSIFLSIYFRGSNFFHLQKAGLRLRF